MPDEVRSPLDVVVLGLSITSSWGNGHATTYRGLLRELAARGHRVTFLERDVPWYAAHRDMPSADYCRVGLYSDLDDLRDRFSGVVGWADFVMVGSYVPQGQQVGQWVQQTAGGAVGFYDIDTPVTLARLAEGQCEYLAAQQIAGYDVYLSFAGGPTLELLERQYGSPMARALYCCVDCGAYSPCDWAPQWDLGYLGTYSDDRQETLERLLIDPARAWPDGRFAVAGPQYPPEINWPANVHRVEHLPPVDHRDFYTRQRYTLNVTRRDMIRAGYSPSVRLFEAAACATPIISDYWAGLETFFRPGVEILIARAPQQVLEILSDVDEMRRRRIGHRARQRVLDGHTAAHRAAELEAYIAQALDRRSRRAGVR